MAKNPHAYGTHRSGSMHVVHIRKGVEGASLGLAMGFVLPAIENNL